MGLHHSIEHFDYKNLGTSSLHVKLSEEDIKVLRNSWGSILNNDEIGLAIMVRILKEHQSIKQVFFFATKLETEVEMRKDSQVLYHARKLSTTFDKIVNDLDAELNNHKEFLIKLGRKHYHYDVKYEYFQNFHEALFFALKNNLNTEIFNKETMEAWNKLILLIAEYLSQGIRKEANQQQ